jgi:hypothetical protein
LYEYKGSVGKPEGIISLGRPDENKRIILIRILEKWGEKVCTGFIWLRIWIRLLFTQ